MDFTIKQIGPPSPAPPPPQVGPPAVTPSATDLEGLAASRPQNYPQIPLQPDDPEKMAADLAAVAARGGGGGTEPAAPAPGEFTIKSIAPPPVENAPATMARHLWDSIIGMGQRVTPQPGNAPLAPPDIQDAFDELGPSAGLPLDRYAILRNPDTGRLAVYMKTPEMSKGAGPLGQGALGLGRLLSQGAVTQTPTRIAGGVQPPSPSANLLQDFEKVGVTPTLPAIVQNHGLSEVANWAKNVPMAGQPIVAGAQRGIEETAQAAANAAGRYGTPMAQDQAGRMLQGAAENFRYGAAPVGVNAAELPTRATSIAAKASALYQRIPVPPSAPTILDSTKAALQGLSERFASNPEFGKTLLEPKFATWLDKLNKGGGLTWQELRDFRSYIGAKIGARSLNDPIPVQDYKTLYRGVSQDMQATAQNVSPQAARAAAQADRYYSAAMDRTDGALKTIFNAASPEKAYQRIIDASSTSASKADIGRLYALKRSMPADDWNDLAATVISNLGRTVPSATDPLSAANFSVASFTTRWSQMSEKAKDVLFSGPGMKDARENLDTLSRVVAAQQNVDRLRNTSGTARELLIGGGVAAALAEPLTTMMSLVGTYLGSAAMMSPAVTRWLVAGRTLQSPTQLAAHVAKLSQVAEHEPEFAEGVKALQGAYTQLRSGSASANTDARPASQR